MATYLYFYPECSFKTLKKALAAFDAAGYDSDKLRIGPDWPEFLRHVPAGDTITVYSVEFFGSLMELLNTLATLQERSITLQSLKEPWLSEQVGSTTEFLAKLRELATLLHQNRTRAGLEKARSEGKKLGRPVGWRKDRTRGRG